MTARNRANFKSNLQLTLLILPPAALVFIFAYCPLPGLVLAFKDFVPRLGIWASDWIGLDNFRFLFLSGTAYRILRNTIFMNSLFIVLGTLANVGLALLLFELTRPRLIKTYYTILMFPNFMSWVVAGYLTYAILNPSYGLLNSVLANFGVEPIGWYSNASYWPAILTVTHIWKQLGMGSVIYYSVLVSSDPQMYEAATIDGASRSQMARYISVPVLVPMITILFIMAVGRIINSDFGLFFYITRDVGLLYRTTDVLDTFVYRSLMRSHDVGRAAAAGFFQSCAGFVFVFVMNLIIRKTAPENALF